MSTMSTENTISREEVTIKIVVDARYARTWFSDFTAETYPDYEDRYEAAADCFNRMLDKLTTTNANKGGMVSMYEGDDSLTVMVSEDGTIRETI